MANGPDLRSAKTADASGVEQALAQAVSALDGKRPHDAERIVGEVLKETPQHHRALYLLGCALLMQGRGEQAIAPLETAARGRHDPEIETMLGTALRQAGRLDAARSQLTRAAKRRPPYALAFYELGCLLVAMDRDDEAIDAFRRGLDIAPMMPQLSIQLGYALLWRKRCMEAKAAFAQALDIAPRSAEALVGMGKAHRDIGESEPATEYFRRALAVRPQDPGIWLALGLCLQDVGEADAARDAFRRAAGGERKRYDRALKSLAASGHGRFWLKPSAAAEFFQVPEL